MTHGRKPRRIRWTATTDTLETARRRAALVTPAELAETMRPFDDAFKALREGVASEWQWAELATAINVAMAVEKQGIVRGIHEHLHAAELALGSIRRRAMTTGNWKPTALYYLELDAIREALALHKFQLQQLSRGEVIKALDYATAEVRSSGGQALERSTKPHGSEIHTLPVQEILL